MEQVELRVKGKVDTDWSDWLGGLTVDHTAEGETVLTGAVRDQSALLGVLNRILNLGMQLLSVKSQKIDDRIRDTD
jgi:hypothetical protein